jgi:hypothetical protein
VRPHAMTDQLPGGRLWDIMGLQSQRGPLSPGAILMGSGQRPSPRTSEIGISQVS